MLGYCASDAGAQATGGTERGRGWSLHLTDAQTDFACVLKDPEAGRVSWTVKSQESPANRGRSGRLGKEEVVTGARWGDVTAVRLQA